MKVLNHIGMFAAIALAFVGCSKEIEIQKPEDNLGTHTLTFKVEKTVDTRTSIVEGDEKSSYIWIDGDEANFNIFENNIKAKSTEVTFSDDFKTATVKATFQNTDATSFEYTAIFAKSLSDTHNPLVLNEQSPELESFDPSADILVTEEPLVLDGNAQSNENTEFLFVFKRVVSVNKMTLKGLTPGEVVTDVVITTDKNISARYKLSDGSYIANSNILTLKYNTKETVVGTVGEDGTFPVYFVAAPIEGASFSVRLATNQNVYERTLTSKLTFSVGTFRRFGINLEGYGQPVQDAVDYTLVEDDDQIAANGEYLIVSTKTGGTDYVAAGAFSSNMYSSVAVAAPNNKVITISSEPVTVFTLESSSTNGQFYILDSDGYYLYYTGTKNTISRNQTKDGNSYLWTVSKSDGIKNVATDTRVIQFNRSDPRFTCYTGAQTAISLYVNTKSLVPLNDPELSFTSNEVEVNWEDIEEFSAPELSNPHNVAVTYSSSNEEVATVSSTGEITFVGNGTTIITATSAKGNGYAAGTAQYTLAVTGAPVNYDFTTIAELNGLATSNATEYTGTLTNVVVSYVPDTGNAIIKDATGSILVFKANHDLLQGQSFSGELKVTLKKFYTTIEITDFDASFNGEQTVVAPESKTLESLVGNFDSYQNTYVKVEDLTVTNRDGKNIFVSNGDNTYVVYDSEGFSTASTGDIISVIGTVADHNGTNQIKAWDSNSITITTVAPKAITFSQPSTGGSFIVSVGGSNITSGTTVASGTTVTLTAAPATGYTFNGWTVTGATVTDATAATTTFEMGSSAVSIAASFKVEGSTAPAVGTVLWTDTFGTSWGGTSTTFTDQALLSTYDYAGRSGYSDNTDVTLTADSNNVRGTKSSGSNCSGSHLWFNKSTDGTVTTSAIRLYGATSLVLTYDQGTSGSSITAGYSTDGGTTWTNFSASGPATNNECTFTVPSGTTSVILRFVHSSSNAKNTRFDNPKLAVGN